MLGYSIEDTNWSMSYITSTSPSDREKFPSGYWYVHALLKLSDDDVVEGNFIEGEGVAATTEAALAMCLDSLVTNLKEKKT